MDSIPDFHDRWNFGPKFPVKILASTSTEEDFILPTDFVLYQNYPNPFNPSTKLSFVIGHSSSVSLKVYDVLGNEVSILIDEQKAPGEYEVVFSANELPSGIYYYRLESENFVQTRKMVLLK